MNEEKKHTEKNNRMIGAGLAIGVGVGVALGNIALGVALGLVFGIVMSKQQADNEDNPEE